jgi:copper chaperone CopZ
MRPAATRTIEIGGMSGDPCVQKVIVALNRVSGVRIESIQVGRAVIDCAFPAAFVAACGAICYAGYRARERPAPIVPVGRLTA